MKIYCRRFGVVAYQNRTNTAESFLKWNEEIALKGIGFDVEETFHSLIIRVFSEYGYEKTITLHYKDWIVFEFGEIIKYTDKEFKSLFREMEV